MGETGPGRGKMGAGESVQRRGCRAPVNPHCQLLRLTSNVTAQRSKGNRASKYTDLRKEAGSWEECQVPGLRSKGEGSLGGLKSEVGPLARLRGNSKDKSVSREQ